MSPDWNWDFEDRPNRPREPAAPPPAGSPSLDGLDAERNEQARFRRRRTGALLLAGLLVLAVVLLAAQPGSKARPPAASARSDPHRLSAAAPQPDTMQLEAHAVAAVLAYTPFVNREATRA